MPQYFIGFNTLEDFLAAVDDQRDLHLTTISTIEHGSYLDTVTALVIASQVKDDHLIYCRIRAARYGRMLIGNEMQPVSDRDIERARRAPDLQQQLYTIAVQLIQQRLPDTLIAAGVPSFPTNLTLIDGSIDSATYDRDTGAYVLKQSTWTPAESVA